MLTEHIIPSAVRTGPLSRYILRAWPLLPGHAVRDLIKNRDIRVNGARVASDVDVHGGDTLAVYLPDRYDPAPADIVYTDGKLIATVKPQGLPVDADRDGVGADTLLTRVRKLHPGARLCHRLDAGTGGIVLAATDKTVYEHAVAMFAEHSLQKTYVALVKGGFREGEGTLKAWLLKDPKTSTVRVIHHAQPGSKPIETHWRLIGGNDKLARVELIPITGRTHQLRAHMADFGHPILMDDKYGDRKLNREYRGQIRLWCHTLEVGAKSALAEYRGRKFVSSLPDWFEQ